MREESGAGAGTGAAAVGALAVAPLIQGMARNHASNILDQLTQMELETLLQQMTPSQKLRVDAEIQKVVGPHVLQTITRKEEFPAQYQAQGRNLLNSFRAHAGEPAAARRIMYLTVADGLEKAFLDEGLDAATAKGKAQAMALPMKDLLGVQASVPEITKLPLLDRGYQWANSPMIPSMSARKSTSWIKSPQARAATDVLLGSLNRKSMGLLLGGGVLGAGLGLRTALRERSEAKEDMYEPSSLTEEQLRSLDDKRTHKNVPHMQAVGDLDRMVKRVRGFMSNNKRELAQNLATYATLMEYYAGG